MVRKEKIEELNTYIEELKTIKCIEKIASKPGFLTIEKYQCTLNNGQTIAREKLVKGGKDGSAAIILPITKEGDVVLSVESRVFTKETVDVGLPAGYIEENERAIDAAKRELLEETGYVVKEENMKYLGSFYQDQGCSKALNEYFLALDCELHECQNLDKDEYIKYFICTFDEMLELLQKGYIKGLNSAFAIEKAKKYIYERQIDREI